MQIRTPSKTKRSPNKSNSINPQQSPPQSKQLRLNGELLRVRTYQQIKQVQEIWAMNEEEIIDFLGKYQTLPTTNHKINPAQLFHLPHVKLVRNEHKLYFGQITNKKKHGLGISIYRQGKIYQGEYVENEKQGEGVQVYANGNLYIGGFNQNKKHGRGVFYWFSLCQSSCSKSSQNYIQHYDGSWWGGLPDGQGSHQKANGDFYLGTFKNGLKHGNGIQYYSNRDKYKGEFINGLPEGYGQYTWDDGSTYKGDFKQGYRNGYGVWHNNPPSNQSYKGHYMLDRKHGFGIYTWSDGYIYKGNFMEDLRNGQGQLLHNNDSIYKGYWRNGQRCDQIDFKNGLLSKSTVKPRSDSKSLSREKHRDKSATTKNRTRTGNDSFLVNFHQTQAKSRVGHRNCVPCQIIQQRNRQKLLQNRSRSKNK